MKEYKRDNRNTFHIIKNNRNQIIISTSKTDKLAAPIFTIFTIGFVLFIRKGLENDLVVLFFSMSFFLIGLWLGATEWRDYIIDRSGISITYFSCITRKRPWDYYKSINVFEGKGESAEVKGQRLMVIQFKPKKRIKRIMDYTCILYSYDLYKDLLEFVPKNIVTTPLGNEKTRYDAFGYAYSSDPEENMTDYAREKKRKEDQRKAEEEKQRKAENMKRRGW